jgi:hypothetical protein
LCQINKSAEVDSYKLKVDGAFRIVVPRQFSVATSDYLDLITRRHTFTESNGLIKYDELPLFDLGDGRQQPDVQLYKVRVDPRRPGVESVVRYVEIRNVFRSTSDKYLLFVADAALRVDATPTGVEVRVNQTRVEVCAAFFNDAVSFVPCFTYADSEDAVLLASRHITYHVDGGGQHHVDYYGADSASDFKLRRRRRRDAAPPRRRLHDHQRVGAAISRSAQETARAWSSRPNRY